MFEQTRCENKQTKWCMGSKFLSLSLRKCNYNQKGEKIIIILKGRNKIAPYLLVGKLRMNPSSVHVGLQMSTNSSKNTFKKELCTYAILQCSATFTQERWMQHWCMNVSSGFLIIARYIK